MLLRRKGGKTMARNEWNDEQIEKLLKEMPDVKDARPATEILQNLRNDDRLSKQHVTSKRGHWMPAIVAVAAVLLFSLLLPSLLKNRSMQMVEDAVKEQIEMSSMDATDEMQESKANHFARHMGVDHARFALYQDELENHIAFPIGLVSDMATSIPVTIIIPQDTIERDVANTVPATFDLYMQYASQIDEEALGFQEYHPYEGELLIEGNAIVHRLPANHPYDRGSAALGVYTNSLQDTFVGFEEVRFQQQDGSPIEFDQVGEEAAPLPLANNRQRVNYYVFTSQTGESFLSTHEGTSYKELTEAIEAMKNQPNDMLQSVIPRDINFTVKKEKMGTVITFSEPVDLESMEPVEAQLMIDGILLTAASFNESIRFENMVQSDWNGFDFSTFLPIPVGPNPLPAPFK